MARFDPRFLPPAGPGFYGAAVTSAVVAHQRENAELLGRGIPKVLYNPNYYANLIAQGHTHDPATGLELFPKGFSRAEQQKRITMDRDLDALSSAFQSGEVDVSQLSGAMDRLERTYGPDKLLLNEKYRKLTGSESAYQHAIQQKKDAFAKATGIAPEGVTWNEEEGRPEADREFLAAQSVATQIQERKLRPVREFQETQIRLADEQAKTNRKLVESAFAVNTSEKSNMPPEQAYHLLTQGLKDAERIRQETVNNILGKPPVLAPQGGTPLVPAATHAKLPAGTQILGRFGTAQEARAAGAKPGDYFMLGPYLARVNPTTGALEKVD